MAEKPEKTMFDMLALVMRVFSVLVWITMAVTGYIWFSAANAAGVDHVVWAEVVGIGSVFLMSLVLWWYAGFVSRKGREKEMERRAREE